MSTKHTPGPWQYYADLPSVEPNWHIVTNESRMRVLANVHIEPGNEMDVANARLIAAAPDLLEALRDVLRTSEAEAKTLASGKVARENFSADDYELRALERAMVASLEAEARARAAIAKATGEQS